MTNQIICGDSLKVLSGLPHARMIFADPPDNLGMKYEGYEDKLKPCAYASWLDRLIRSAVDAGPDVFWLSFYHSYLPQVYRLADYDDRYETRLFLWRFTFGQHRSTDCGNGFRSILRWSKAGMVWNTDAIRVQSQRQRNGDKRADPRGRVPDDVWEFSRVCGTFKERRQWIPCQHPEALVERMIRLSCRPGDTVIDLFAGSGVTNRVGPRCGVNVCAVDISRAYCEKVAEETGAELVEHESAPKCASLFQERGQNPLDMAGAVP